MAWLQEAIAGAGQPAGTPIVLAVVAPVGAESIASGIWPNGRPVEVADRFYAASLAKQVTAAAVAVLVKEGRLDADAPLGANLGHLPSWARGITARHLVHHIADLPEAGKLEASTSGDWTTDVALEALASGPVPQGLPGAAYRYSNVGYVLLARLVEAIARTPFATFVAGRLLEPLGLDGTDRSLEAHRTRADSRHIRQPRWTPSQAGMLRQIPDAST